MFFVVFLLQKNEKSSSERTGNGSVNWCCHLLAMMNQQRFDDRGNCDTILTTTSGASFMAHSIILAASSPLLNVELPVHGLCESGYASNLGEVASLTLSNILEFLYTGKLRCGIDSLDDMRILAEKVGVTKLVDSVTRLQTQLRSVKHVGADVRSVTFTEDMTPTDPLTTGNATHTNHRQQRVRQLLDETDSVIETGSIKRTMPQVHTGIKTTYERVLTDHHHPLVLIKDDDPTTSNTTDNSADVANTSNIENTANAESTANVENSTTPHSKGYYYCRICVRKFKKGEHTRCLPYQCDKCGVRCRFSSNMRKHTLLHIRDENSWTCTICQANCQSKVNLLNHQQAEHGGEHLPIKCESCTKSFHLPEQLKRHMLYHKKTEHVCSDCGKMCISKFKLQKHMIRHQSLTCNLCSLVFKGKFLLKKHRRKCAPTKQTQKRKSKKQLTSEYSCPKCNKYFSNKDFLEVHLRSDKCDKCSKMISCETHFKMHLNRHFRKKIISCEMCNKEFGSSYWLGMHKLTHSEGNYSCNKCSQVFTSHNHLVLHKQTHNKRTYSCDKCPKAFRFNSLLKQHLNSHKEREYICRLCKKMFLRKFHLEVHERTRTREKPFMCSVCAKGFISKRALEGHELLHRPKEHKCETCGKEFRWLKPYQKHISEHKNVTKQKAASNYVNKCGNISG